MPQNSEQIEAKLCAYLEGELDEQDRAEIEKHLQANPAHRKLLAEVAGTRDLLRALPREAAPADLCETLQGHLERSVLLGDTADAQADTAMRIGRWRPIFAIAAMIVLAVGLGLVIYFGLPSAAQRQPHAYVTNTPAMGPVPGGGSASTLPAEKPEETTATREAFADGGAAARRGMGISDNAAATGTSTASTTGPAANPAVALSSTAPGDDGAPESLQSLAQRVPKLWSPEQQRALFYARGRRGDAAGLPAGPAVYLVLSTPEPTAAREEVTQELEKLQLAWETVPTTLALATRDEAVPGLAESEFARKRGEVAEKRVATAGGMRGGAAPGGGPGAASAATAPASEPQPSGLADAGTELRRPQPSSRAGVPAVPPVAAATPAPARAPGDSFAGALPALSPAPAPDASTPAPTMILARNVTRRQAELLCTTLGARRADQQAALWTAQDGVSFAPVKQDVAQVRATVREEVADATQPAPPPVAGQGGNAGPKSQVALRNASKDADVQQRATANVGIAGAGAGAGGGAGAPGKEAKAAPAGTKEGIAGRRFSKPSTGVAADSDGAAEVDRSKSSPLAQAKEPAATRAHALKAEVARTPAQKARPSESTTTGRGLATGDTESAGADPLAAEDAPSAGADKETSPRETSPGETLPQTPEARAIDSRPATRSTAAAANEEERIDLVIVVKSPDAALGVAGSDAQPAAPAPAGPIEKYEILMVTVGDADGTNVRVGEDGSIDLPPAGRIAAEGLTAEALGKRIAESLGRTDAGAKVTVTRPGAGGAATQPDEKGDAQPQTRATGGDAAPQPPQDPQSPPPASTSPTPAQH